MATATKMKLYYSPGACSLSPHIVMRELGLDVELCKVSFDTGKAEDGKDILSFNAKGYIPVLEIRSGEYLTEGAAIVQYLADQFPEKNLVPRAGTIERYRVMETLNFLASEVHKGFSPLFRDDLPAELENSFKDSLGKSLTLVANQLGKRDYLMGSTFSVCDAYLFTVLSWSKFVELDLAQWPTLQAYSGRIAERPAVQTALRAEGLLK